MEKDKTTTPLEPATYTVSDVAQLLNIGRTASYNLMKEGHFRVVRVGNSLRISKKSFDEWLNGLTL